MPWKTTTPMTERLRLIERYQTRLWRLTELGTRQQQSSNRRQVAGALLARGLLRGSRRRVARPLSCPHRSAAPVAAMRSEAKSRRPAWGPRQLLPDGAARPGSRVAGREQGWRPRPQRGVVAVDAAAAPAAASGRPDAPPERRTRGGRRCTGPCRAGDGVSGSPLTVADASARARLGGTARLSTRPVAAPPVCARLCREDGRPAAIRPDHGAPLATPAFGGLSTQSVWWITRGIRHQRLEPGRPEPHGRHERLHRPH